MWLLIHAVINNNQGADITDYGLSTQALIKYKDIILPV